MEVPRMLLAIAGHFPGDYVDGRYTNAEGDLTQNLGRMPMLEYDGQAIGQSAAINFFLATELSLMGSNSLQAARIVSVYEHLKELMTNYRNLVPWGTEPTAEQDEKWFEGGATDSTGPADGSNRTRYLTWFLGRIEAALDNHGFAVGDKLSLADVLLYFSLAEHLDAEQAGTLPKFRREAFGNKDRTDAAIAKHPKIHAAVQAVANHPNIQKWLSVRGVQGF